jgi:hypothetical protein
MKMMSGPVVVVGCPQQNQGSDERFREMRKEKGSERQTDAILVWPLYLHDAPTEQRSLNKI